MHTYSQSISEGSGSICSLGSHPSDLLRVYMYTQYVYLLYSILFVFFFFFLFSHFSFFFCNEFPQTRGFFEVRQS